MNGDLANTDRNISGYLEKKSPKVRRKRSLKGRTWTHSPVHVEGCLICQPVWEPGICCMDDEVAWYTDI